jgi:hypothetical protein
VRLDSFETREEYRHMLFRGHGLRFPSVPP